MKVVNVKRIIMLERIIRDCSCIHTKIQMETDDPYVIYK